MRKKFTGALAGAAALLTCLTATPALPACGTASWYGPGFHGKPTASGARGAVLRVTRGNRSVVVVVNDRGPFVKRRDLDLSRGAAAELKMIAAGVGRVCWERIK